MQPEQLILRATMQTDSPLIINSGDVDALTDTEPVRDANGLPMLPASSLAGVLRAAVGQQADRWFGCESRTGGQRSAVTLTDGLLHWSDDRPRDGLITDPAELAALAADPVCRHVLPGSSELVRQHVRLNERGTVDRDGKFSRDAVPTGARFTFELRTSNRAAADRLASVIGAGLHLGGATRAGYGALTCIAIGRADLTLPKDWARWCEIMGASLETRRGIAMQAPAAATQAAREWRVKGRIEGPLLIGGDGQKDAEDRAPWREPQFRWDSASGRLVPDVFVIPGSAIKGPIRHRTLFHLRNAGLTDTEADAIFGSQATPTGGAAGWLRFHDCQIPDGTTTFQQTHVGLDRFTGGPRRGLLFTDAALWRPCLDIRITELPGARLTQRHRAALTAALQDLAAGRLGLGAEWGEGAGVFHDAILTQPAELAHAA